MVILKINILLMHLKAMKFKKAFRRVLRSPLQASNIAHTLVAVEVNITFDVIKGVKVFGYH